MTAIVQRETAKIYEFPVGGRAGRPGRLGGHFGLSKLEREFAELPATVYGDGWYHDEAIADDRAGKH